MTAPFGWSPVRAGDVVRRSHWTPGVRLRVDVCAESTFRGTWFRNGVEGVRSPNVWPQDGEWLLVW